MTLDEVIAAAREAADAVLEVYATEFEARTKEDGSPVTEADERAQEIILRHLGNELPVIAEEDATAGSETPAGPFWLVDPLDGTKEFLGRNGEFTINIARIEEGVPVLGVVLAPALGRLFAAAPASARLSTTRADDGRSRCGTFPRRERRSSRAAPTATPKPSTGSPQTGAWPRRCRLVRR